MPISDYADHDAFGLAEPIRRREVTPQELCDEAMRTFLSVRAGALQEVVK
jgi:hypothetical protein